ncbi:MAG: hypothetical protein JWO37_1589 [Acidimicrobiales bacterium]|jgi:hypothetical protein|nr:hypothetical protein [Acidimicrobiales bacterium]
MNLLGHAHVAVALGVTDPVFVLGAVLPDLASMAGARLDRDRMAGPLAAGVALHHRADAAFHAEPAFVAGTVALRKDLDTAGIRPGSSRAIAHVGWELLLDGTLLHSPAEAAFWDAMTMIGASSEAVGPAGRDRWSAFVRRWDRPRPALRYDDSSWVADRVHDMMGRRPRLAFPAEQRAAVRDVLAMHAPRVRLTAAAVLDATTSRVAVTTR